MEYNLALTNSLVESMHKSSAALPQLLQVGFEMEKMDPRDLAPVVTRVQEYIVGIDARLAMDYALTFHLAIKVSFLYNYKFHNVYIHNLFTIQIAEAAQVDGVDEGAVWEYVKSVVAPKIQEIQVDKDKALLGQYLIDYAQHSTLSEVSNSISAS